MILLRRFLFFEALLNRYCAAFICPVVLWVSVHPCPRNSDIKHKNYDSFLKNMFPPLPTQDFSGLPLGAKFHLVIMSMLFLLQLMMSNLILCNILVHR